MEMTQPSHTPAHNCTATVASFRTWRGLQRIVARGPSWATIVIQKGMCPSEGSALSGFRRIMQI